MTESPGRLGADAPPPDDAGTQAGTRAPHHLRTVLSGSRRVLAAGAGVLVVAVVLLTRFSVHAQLSRDEGIYIYGAQRFSHGVPPYVSIFDPKTPGTTLLAGVALTVARWVHLDGLDAIRWTFFVITLATVLAVFVLAYQLWSSIPAAIAAAVTMCCFTVFAQSGLMGPEAKMPGLLFGTISMCLMVRRRWFWAGVFSGLAFDFWQPFVGFGLIAIIASVLDADRGRRLRNGLVTFGGAALPSVLLAIYFAASGALSQFLVAAFIYPLTGTKRGQETLRVHFTHVAAVLAHYPMTALLWWTGTVLLIALVVAAFVRGRGRPRSVWRSPLVLVVFMTFVLNLGYAFFDFQAGPDTLPLLVYPALGIGGAAAFVLGVERSAVQRRAAVAVIAVLGLAAVSISWVTFGDLSRRDPTMRPQLADACGLTRLLGNDGQLVSLGNPLLFVLTHRVSPSNFIYLGAGVDDWKIKHTRGGFTGWAHQIIGPKPAIVAISEWELSHKTHNPNIVAMRRYLHAHGYRRRYLGPWALWMNRHTRMSARSLGVQLSGHPTPEARLLDGERLPSIGTACENH